MANLRYRSKSIKNHEEISSVMRSEGLFYEYWKPRHHAGVTDQEILTIYEPEIQKISFGRGYVSSDLVSLSTKTPNLDAILAKFSKEHHHEEDEVRFTVEGEGIFVIKANGGDELEFTSEPGDLIVIPAHRRHYFTLTASKHIRTIRLFKNQNGWEAIYDPPKK